MSKHKLTLREDRYPLSRQDMLWLKTRVPRYPDVDQLVCGQFCQLGHLHRTFTWYSCREWLRYELASYDLLVRGPRWGKGVEAHALQTCVCL